MRTYFRARGRDSSRNTRRTLLTAATSAVAIMGATLMSTPANATAPIAASVQIAALPAITVAPPATRAAPALRTLENAKVQKAADGDTLWVKIGKKKNRELIRFVGVQATEIAHRGAGKNWCHGLTAKKFMNDLTKGRKVKLKGLYKSSSSLGRKYRTVFVKRDGVWVDVQAALLQAGLGIASPDDKEWVQNRLYMTLMQQAMHQGINMWNTATCGVGPQQHVPLRVGLNWDAAGDDHVNVNDEYVVVRNDSSETVPLAGWSVRTRTHAMFDFPDWASVPPKGQVVLHVGKGNNDQRNFYWGSSVPMFRNVDSKDSGDTAILLDPQGDFRAYSTYPCYAGPCS